jgi:WD40 repeat protein
VHINSFTFNLFSFYLSQNELILLASIINDKIVFRKVVNDQISVNEQMDCNLLVELEQYSPGKKEMSSFSNRFTYFPSLFLFFSSKNKLGQNEKAIHFNPLFSSKITLGVPGTGELLAQLKEKSLIFRDVTIPDLKKESLYKVWMDKLIRPKYTLTKIIEQEKDDSSNKNKKKKMKRIEAPPPPANTSSSASPGPQAQQPPAEENIDDTWTSLVVNPSSLPQEEDERGGRQALQNALAEPSIIFSTISNCEEGLICMNINPQITQAVTGYQDSIVRVWRLDENVDQLKENRHSQVPHFGRNLTNNKNYHFEMNEVLPKPKDAFTADYIISHKQQEELNNNNSSSNNNNNSGNSMKTPKRQHFPMTELKGHSGPIYSVDQNYSQRLVLSSSADESIRLWDTSVLQCVGKYSCSSIAWEVRFNAVLDYYFAAANQDSTVTLYSTDRILPLRMFTGHISDVNCVTWHGNNTSIASGSDDRTVRLWDIRSANCHRLLKGSNSAITSVQICPVGNLLAAGNELGKIYLYDLRSSRILSVLQGHDNHTAVYSLSFNNENNTLVSGGEDCSVRIWDLWPSFETTFLSTTAYQVNAPVNSTGNNGNINGIHNSHNNTTSSSSHGAPETHPTTSSSAVTPVPAGTETVASATVHGSSSASSSSSSSFGNYITKVLKPKHSFFTKASPVYQVGFTKDNLMYGGGPCSFLTAASKTYFFFALYFDLLLTQLSLGSREKYLFATSSNTSSGNPTGGGTSKKGSIALMTNAAESNISEQEAINLLGINAPTSSNS